MKLQRFNKKKKRNSKTLPRSKKSTYKSSRIFEANKDHVHTIEQKEPDLKEFQDIVRSKLMEQMV